MKKRTSGLTLLRSPGQARRRIARTLVIAASGMAVIAGIRMLRRRRLEAGERFAERETEIDDRIAESFPASDPPWHP